MGTRLPHDSVIFLGGREHSTVKELSEVLGKETISMQTEGKSFGQSPSHSQNLQRHGRELMTMDELTTMPGDRCILQLRGLRPFYSKKYDLKLHPNYCHTAEANPKRNKFNTNALVSRKLTVLPTDEYVMFEVTLDEQEDILNYDDLDDFDDWDGV